LEAIASMVPSFENANPHILGSTFAWRYISAAVLGLRNRKVPSVHATTKKDSSGERVCNGPKNLDSFLGILRGYLAPNEQAAKQSRTHRIISFGESGSDDPIIEHYF
jgi:hypothetical protein